MIRMFLRLLTGRRDPVPAASRASSEIDHVLAQRVEAQRRTEADAAPYWCRPCGRPVHHPQCPLCRRPTWARRTGMHEVDVMPRKGTA